MDTIIRGTTPTFRFYFEKVDIGNIVSAYLVAKQHKKTVLEKDLSDASKSEKSLMWTLTQEDSLSLPESGFLTICCDWKLEDDTRGRSAVGEYRLADAGRNDVI